jgi:hypothetical protein
MAMIFPSQLVNDIRKCVQPPGTPWKKREIRFPGDVIPPICVEASPGEQQVGLSLVPIWCSSCGDELPKGLIVIRVRYDIHPGQSISDPFDSWFHMEKCKHAGDAP